MHDRNTLGGISFVSPEGEKGAYEGKKKGQGNNEAKNRRGWSLGSKREPAVTEGGEKRENGGIRKLCIRRGAFLRIAEATATHRPPT